MGRRRQSSPRSNLDESDSEKIQIRVSTCRHVRDATNLPIVRRVLSKLSVAAFEECSDCASSQLPTNCAKVNSLQTAASLKVNVPPQDDCATGSVLPCDVVVEPPMSFEENDNGKALTVQSADQFVVDESPKVIMKTTIWLCLQCGYRGCGRTSTHKHALTHCRKPRSDKHCLVLCLSTLDIWCYECDEEVYPDNQKLLQEIVNVVGKHMSSSTAAGANGSKSTNGHVSNASLCSSEKEATRPTATNKTCSKLANSNYAPRGLSNLGNTCFFNSAIQCLAATQGFAEFLVSVSRCSTLRLAASCAVCEPLESPELCLSLKESSGALTSSLAQLLAAVANSNSDCISPSVVFGQVASKNSRFRGYRQQDSHELLRTLLDMIKKEEIRRGQEAILNHFLFNKRKEDLSSVELAQIKFYGHRVAESTSVDRAFGGYLLSSVVCQTCLTPSQICEAFLDISLSLNDEYRAVDTTGCSSSDRRKAASHLSSSTNNHCSKHQIKKQKRLRQKASKQRPPIKSSTENADEEKQDAEKVVVLDTTTECDNLEKRIESDDGDVEDNLDVSGETVCEKDELCPKLGELTLKSDVEQVAKMRAMQHLSRPTTPSAPESLEARLAQFVQPELLTGANRVHCERCSAAADVKIYRDACKQYLILRPPAMLTLQLKRFQQVGLSLQKDNRRVTFPLCLNLAPYCSAALPQLDSENFVTNGVLYQLYGLVVHSGRLSGGHYTAYVRHSVGSKMVGSPLINLVALTRRMPKEPVRRLCLQDILPTAFPECKDDKSGENVGRQDDASKADGQWFYISDSMVRTATVEQVLDAQAYLLFYERIC